MNKLFIILLSVTFLVISSCATGIKTTTKGVDNTSYLEFVGEPRFYPDGVEVILNNKTAFIAGVNVSEDQIGGISYAIPPGKHDLEVRAGGELIYSKQIFISTQETKQIMLP